MPKLPGSPTRIGHSERAAPRSAGGGSIAPSGKPKKSAAETWKALPEVWALLQPRKGVLLAGFGLMAINRVSGLVLPASTKFLVDNIIGKRQIEFLGWLILAVVGATLVQGLTSFTLTQLLSKSAQRMSPEQIRGDELDTRSDIFSFGLLVYEMATGQKAFGGGTGGVIIEAILSGTRTPVRTVNPGIPVELEAIIDKAIEKDKDKRYQSAEEIRADLQELRQGFESSHKPLQLLAAAGRRKFAWTKFIKWAVPSILAAVAAMIGFPSGSMSGYSVFAMSAPITATSARCAFSASLKKRPLRGLELNTSSVAGSVPL